MGAINERRPSRLGPATALKKPWVRYSGCSSLAGLLPVLVLVLAGGGGYPHYVNVVWTQATLAFLLVSVCM